MKAPPLDAALACPTPGAPTTVQLAHGGGGRLMRALLDRLVLPAFPGAALAARHDGAALSLGGARLAFTTDSYVVTPRFFPGGDIGRLAVFGTVNDLAMTGGRPAYVSVGLILEEGLPLEELARVVASLQRAAEEAGVEVVTGDTKVVDRGKGDGLFVNTSGLGLIPDGIDLAPRRILPGDAVLVSGDLGRHGIAVLSVREGLAFECPVESDCAPLGALVESLLAPGVEVHCLRDLTRGGLAAALDELAVAAGVAIELSEPALPVCDAVAGACELLGIDPLYVANEGRLVAFVPERDADAALARLRGHPQGRAAAHVGWVTRPGPGAVLVESRVGGRRLLDLPAGEALPRIC